MKITFDTKSAKADALVVFAAQGGTLLKEGVALDKKEKGLIKRAIKAEKFKGDAGTSIVVTGGNAPYIVVLGLGKTKSADTLVFEKLGDTLARLLCARKATSANVLCEGLELPKTLPPEKAVTAMAEFALLADYRFDKYKTKAPKDKKPALKSISFSLKAAARAKELFAAREKVAAGAFLTRDLVTEVPNVLYPETFASIIKKEMKPLGVTVKVLTETDMKRLGMGALISVGQGSARPPRLVVMEYKKGGKGAKNVAFVGKGVTFDTGGISLKPGAGMGDMKWDMGGAGTVTGLMKAIAGRKAKANVIGIAVLAENMPDGKASRPGDVVKTMSGQTVEILNTDAEGRLILCDALWYCQKTYKPDRIIDLATLTGAMIVALGHEYAGMFTNDDTLARHLTAAGVETGEEVWRLPLHQQWDRDIDSPIADMKNIGGKAAGSATAAHYLKRFIQDGVKWAHLDIAGMAWAYRDKTGIPKGASGFGVRLLDRFVADYCEK